MAMLVKLRYKICEAAEALGVSRAQIEIIIKEGGLVIHADQPGGHRYISLESLTNYIRDREEIPVVGRRVAR